MRAWPIGADFHDVADAGLKLQALRRRLAALGGRYLALAVARHIKLDFLHSSGGVHAIEAGKVALVGTQRWCNRHCLVRPIDSRTGVCAQLVAACGL